jgi:hypothetical protein
MSNLIITFLSILRGEVRRWIRERSSNPSKVSSGQDTGSVERHRRGEGSSNRTTEEGRGAQTTPPERGGELELRRRIGEMGVTSCSSNSCNHTLFMNVIKRSNQFDKNPIKFYSNSNPDLNSTFILKYVDL